MISSIFSRLTVLTFGTLYPAYYSFKAVRAKCVQEYMKWMMYWIVFAVFSAAEPFTDVLLAWLPLYYELKILFILWLLPSMGNGSPILYRKCLHPILKAHEVRIDHTLDQLKDKGQDMVLHYVTTAAVYIGKTVMDIVHKNMPNGILGMMVNQGQVSEQRSIQQESANPIVLYDEETVPLPIGTKVTKRKTTVKANTKHVDDLNALPSTSRGNRGRKARQSKPHLDLDVNLNES